MPLAELDIFSGSRADEAEVYEDEDKSTSRFGRVRFSSVSPSLPLADLSFRSQIMNSIF
jgi:hypothetical protein